MRLNLILWGNRSDISNRVRESLPKPDFIRDLDIALGIFPDLKQEAYLVSWLKDKNNWGKVATVLTMLFLMHLPKDLDLLRWWRPSPFRDVLTVLYEGRTAPVKLGVRGETAGPIMWPITPLIWQPVDPLDTPDTGRFEWCETQILPVMNGTPRLQFQQVNENIEVPVMTDQNRSFLPDLAFILDSSGSMGYDPFAGTGEYDLLLRTVFGVFHWLKEQGLATFLKYSALNFSTRTVYSGWKDWINRSDLHQTLFDYQGGKTALDLNVFHRLVQESIRPFTAFMISDGEVKKPGEVVAFVRKNFSPPQGFVLVQVGAMSRLGHGLESHGFKVHVIEDFHDLGGLVLGEIKQRYVV